VSASRYHTSVFLNCPFDPSYAPLFRALVFTVLDVGLVPRCALELDDAAEIRLEKIFRIISECRFGVHDISRVGLDPATSLPRFNMPLELGIFLGCKRFGEGKQGRKRCLILDRDPYRYRAFVSDLAGQDIHSHGDQPRQLVAEVRAWVRSATGKSNLPGGEEIWKRYQLFQEELPAICDRSRLALPELTFADYVSVVRRWLERSLPGPPPA
jgi:hypothetical protein